MERECAAVISQSGRREVWADCEWERGRRERRAWELSGDERQPLRTRVAIPGCIQAGLRPRNGGPRGLLASRDQSRGQRQIPRRMARKIPGAGVGSVTTLAPPPPERHPATS